MSDLQVEVWDYNAQAFVESSPCPGEKRVRVDYFGDLSNLAVFEVTRQEGSKVFFAVDGNRPLRDWEISLT